MGISGIGVTARVMTSSINQFGPNIVRLYVQNTSKSGTITNIGFFVKAGIPTSGRAMPNPDLPPYVTGPGSYTFVPKEMVIETRDFKVVSIFALMTSSFEGDRVSGLSPMVSLEAAYRRVRVLGFHL